MNTRGEFKIWKRIRRLFVYEDRAGAQGFAAISVVRAGLLHRHSREFQHPEQAGVGPSLPPDLPRHSEGTPAHGHMGDSRCAFAQVDDQLHADRGAAEAARTSRLHPFTGSRPSTTQFAPYLWQFAKHESAWGGTRADWSCCD